MAKVAQQISQSCCAACEICAKYHPMTTAHTIIKRCGGPKVVADWLQIDRSTVQRWVGDGRVPSKRWAPLMMAAKLNGIDIGLNELIPAAAHDAAQLSAVKPKRKAAA